MPSLHACGTRSTVTTFGVGGGVGRAVGVGTGVGVAVGVGAGVT